jgi:hypothetical protein
MHRYILWPRASQALELTLRIQLVAHISFISINPRLECDLSRRLEGKTFIEGGNAQ